MSTEFVLALVPWLAILAGPLMMVVMMRGMSGKSCHQKPARAQGMEDTYEQIRQLQARIAELEGHSQTTEIAR
ncbi:MAG: DUF2933 domain-containing protein [Gemmatimonadota bacterium]|jgi:TolA-binding protein|nr:DUF2933 domain-containing protein [Gemmatimonadota bacterium]